MSSGSRRTKILAIILGTLYAVKVLVFTPIFSDTHVSDEVYYVSSALFFMHRLGLISEFRPPIETRAELVGNNTIVVDVKVNTRLPGINIFMGLYDWRNLEHPALAKILLGLMLVSLGSLVAVRATFLALTTIALSLLFYAMLTRFGLLTLPGIILFLVADWVFVNTYTATIDSLMLVAYVSAYATILLGRRILPMILVSFAAASKATGIVFTVPLVLLYVAEGRKKHVYTSLVLPLSSLAASYGINLLIAEPHELISAITGLMDIRDPFACRLLCLGGVVVEWGSYVLLTPLVWVWIIALPIIIATRYRTSITPVEVLHYYTAGTVISLVALLSIKRAVYVYYYAPITPLLPLVVKDLLETGRLLVRYLHASMRKKCTTREQ